MKHTTKHTPGPWTYSESMGYIGTDEGVICKIASSTGQAGIGKNIVASEQKANARLIAAAPVMYEALKDALACIEQSLTRKEINVRRDRINAALSQAEGN